jgi:prepilin-type N-terminal cleavage/methylation domain-containing protein
MTVKPLNDRRGFTLIEILVVVAIIALLIGILMPSFARAREQSRMVLCQTQMHQFSIAFLAYASANKGRTPGISEDHDADWLGGANKGGRQPEDGTVFKYLGANKNIFRCPTDETVRPPNTLRYSYTGSTLMSGVDPSWVIGAHYQYDSKAASNYSTSDHRTNMRPLRPMMIIEEDPDWYLVGVTNSAWDNDDGVTTRHLKKFGTIGYLDGSVGPVNLPATPHTSGKYFSNNAMCVRVKDKWVSGRSWEDMLWNDATKSGAYGKLIVQKSASDKGVSHATP